VGGLNIALALPTVGQISLYFLRHTMVCVLKHWSESGVGTGTERAENLVSGTGAIIECKNNHWSGRGAETKGRGAGNGAESGSQK